MGPPPAELHDRTSRCRRHHPHRLAGDPGLVEQGREHGRLDKLCFWQRGRHTQQRLLRKERGTLGQRPHIAREAERWQVFLEEGRRHALQRRLVPQEGDLVARKPKTLEIRQHLLQTSGDQELTRRR